ncbi:MAG: HAMP domain-containing sensor histidine kinase [Candidatus Saccharibacteria bacterium]|nr:HAMP domain-containing sensor histidine kinase [Candidatus Saccharibacteria bacterium]
MFSELRNKFILTNMVISTVIIVFAFSLIYGVTAYSQSQSMRRPMDVPNEFSASDMRQVFEREMQEVRSEHLARLAVVLFMVGAMTEILVFFASYYYAERSIRPVKEAYDKQREFIANASHELKTPIAAARANFEALGTDEQPWTDNVDMELERASKLVNDLLMLARTDGRSVAATKREVDLVKIVHKRAQLIEARLGGKELILDIPKKMKTTIADADFTQLLDILLDNAVKYSKSKIVVKMTTKFIYIENDGKTIAPDKISHVFDRFYQTDKTAEGSGLGLAIAKALAVQNHWKIEASSINKLTRFTLSF